MARLLVVVLLLLLSACSADTGESAVTDGSSGDMAAEAPAEPEVAAGEGLGAGQPAADEARDEAGADAADRADGDAVEQALPASTEVRPGERLIKEGRMTIEVAVGEFERGFDQVVRAARELGGSVVGSTSTSTPDGGTSGSVTVRVPVDRYEDLLVGVGGVGEVRHRDITARDVTAEFTDLESRLRHARAQEAFYLGLLEEADGVADAIAVQQQVDGIQATIEQLQGRLNVLEDRTSFSTLTVELVEPGAAPVLAQGERPTFAHYLATARDAFVRVVGTGVVVVVASAPLLLPLLAGFALWRHLGRRERPATVAAES